MFFFATREKSNLFFLIFISLRSPEMTVAYSCSRIFQFPLILIFISFLIAELKGFLFINTMADDGSNGNMDTSGGQNDDDRKLFAGGLAQEATEKDIKDYFAGFGEVASVNLKMDQMTGRSRGFAFVVFNEVETLNTVLAQDHAIKGKKVAVKKAASKQGKIYIGKFKDPSISEDVIREHFEQFGTVVEIQRPVDRSKNSEPKNFCFVTFDKEEPANMLLKKGTLTVAGQEVEVKKVTVKPDNGMMMRGGMGRGGMRGGRGGGGWMGGYGGDWGYGGGWGPYDG